MKTYTNKIRLTLDAGLVETYIVRVKMALVSGQGGKDGSLA